MQTTIDGAPALRDKRHEWAQCPYCGRALIVQAEKQPLMIDGEVIRAGFAVLVCFADNYIEQGPLS